jgi:glycosyltransferase involved in cell wall biosynthesis
LKRASVRAAAMPMGLKVLHIIDGLKPGGAETLLYRLAKRPSDVRHEVVCLAGREWYSEPLEQAGVPVSHLSMDSPATAAAAISRLRKMIRMGKPDVVQTWLYRSNMLGGIAARSTGTPVVWGIHCSSLEPFGPLARGWVRLSGLTSRWIANFVINCSIRSAQLHERLGFGAAPGAVIHNGYDPAAFAPDEAAREKTRASLDISPESFLIGNIARWHAQKDLPNLLEAVRLVRDRDVAVQCLLVGRGLGTDNPELSQEIALRGIGDLVIPLGERSDIPEIARAIDLHVLASCGAEAFPNVVGETMLSETPNAVTGRLRSRAGLLTIGAIILFLVYIAFYSNQPPA